MEDLDLTIVPPEYRELTEEKLDEILSELLKTYNLYATSDIARAKIVGRILEAENERPK